MQDNGIVFYRRFLSGDERGLEQLIALYQRGLLRFLYGYVHDIGLAEDILTDVFMTLYYKRSFKEQDDASLKTYIYKIDTSQYGDVFKKPYVWRFKYPLDIDAMKECTEYFEGKHDFSAFMSKGGQAKTFVREIFECSLDVEDEIITMKIRGDGFLYNMVRIIAGTLVSVGRGYINKEDIPEIILSKERKKAGITAPPEGLMLYDIEY